MFYLFALIAFAEFGVFLYLRRKARVTELRNEKSKRLYAEALRLEQEAKERHELSSRLALAAKRQVAFVGPDAIN